MASPAPPVSRRELSALLAIVALAFAVRVVHVLAMRASPFFEHPQMDALYHVDWARAVARGEDFQPGPFFRAPLYPWFLAGLFRLFGDGLLLPRIAQALLGAATSALAWAIGRRLFDMRTGLLAAAIAAIYWVSIFFDGELLLETLAVPLYLLGLWLTLRASESRRTWPIVAAGAAWGLAAIARPNVLPLLPLLAVWLAWPERRARGWLHALVFLLGCTAPIAPITAYNRLVGNDTVLIASQGGVNLWIGNNPISDGTSAVVPGTREDWWGGYHDAIAQAEHDEGQALRPSEVSQHYTHKALDFAVHQPGAWLALMVRKLRWLAMDWELGNNEEVGFLVRRFSPLALWSAFGWGALLALAVLGFCVVRPSWSRLPLAGFVLVYAATVVLFFVNSRYRVPLVPGLAIYAASGAWAVVDALRARRWQLGLAYVLGAALVYAGSRALVPSETRTIAESNGHQMLGNAATLARDWSAARTEYQLSVDAWQRNWISWRGLAGSQFELGQLEAAEESYQHALELRADDVLALSGLVSVHVKQGRLDDAEGEAQRMCRLQPGSALGMHDLGRVRFHRGDWIGAAEAFRAALEHDSDDFNSAYSLGRALLELHDEHGALAAFEQALHARGSGEPAFVGDAFARAIGLHLQFGQRDEARALAGQMRARLPNDENAARFLNGVGLGD